MGKLSKLRKYLKEKMAEPSSFPAAYEKEGKKPLYRYPQALLYITDMFKDARDTFKPYKTKKIHRKRDLLQSYHGLKNIFTGIAKGIVGVGINFPIRLGFALLYCLYCPFKKDTSVIHQLSLAFHEVRR